MLGDLGVDIFLVSEVVPHCRLKIGKRDLAVVRTHYRVVTAACFLQFGDEIPGVHSRPHAHVERTRRSSVAMIPLSWRPAFCGWWTPIGTRVRLRNRAFSRFVAWAPNCFSRSALTHQSTLSPPLTRPPFSRLSDA